MIEYNEMFRVDSLEELTQDHFSMACVAAVSEEEEDRGILGVPCGCLEEVREYLEGVGDE